MIAHKGLPPERSDSPKPENGLVLEQSYRQKIVARQCLNMLIDIKTALSRQNKMLEIYIDELNASQIRNTAK